MIQFHHVSLSLKNKIIFQDHSFNIPFNSYTCFAGPSGCGKSSALKLLMGILVPQKGFIQVAKTKITPISISELRKRMTYIPQNIHLPVKDGAELLELLQCNHSRSLVNQNMHHLGLEPTMLEHPFAQLSGGQKQRIVISICLARQKEFLLLDEPTSSLDDASIANLISLIKTYSNTTLVSASHHQDWLQAMNHVIQLPLPTTHTDG